MGSGQASSRGMPLFVSGLILLPWKRLMVPIAAFAVLAARIVKAVWTQLDERRA